MNARSPFNLLAPVWRAVFLTAALLLGAAAAQAQTASQQQSQAAYRLAAGDVIRVTVYQNPDLTQEARLSEAGTISFPLIGSVNLLGLTVTQAEQRLADGLRTGNFVKQPQVTVNIVQVRGHQVSVLGQVAKPGRYPLETGDMRLSEMLATAGGVMPGGADVVVLTGTRDGRTIRSEVDMPLIFGQGKRDADVLLRNGDVIWVERAPQVYVYGEVQRPGQMRLERNMTLMQVLASAGGLNGKGTEKGIRVSRRDEQGVVRTLEPKMTDTLRADDVVFVRESLF